MTEVQELARRIENLERRVARWRRGTVLASLAGLLAAAAVWGACAASSPDRHERLAVSTLEIVDGDGMPQAVFQATEAGPVLALADPYGVDRAGLAVTSSGAALALAAADGVERALLSVGTDGSGLFINDEQVRTRLTAGVGQTMGSGVILTDGEGMTRAGLGLDKSRGPSMILLREDGTALTSLP